MTRAAEVQEICTHLLFWEAYDLSVKSDLTSCAWRPSRIGRSGVLIDPIGLTSKAEEQFDELVDPVAIILTNGNHERASKEFAAQYQIPVYAHPEAQREIGDAQWTAPGTNQIHGLRVFELPGAGPGEVALYSELRGGTMIFGDAVINVRFPGFGLLPEKYCQNQKLLIESLRGLLDVPFETALFAHGTPILSGARDRLAALLK